MRAIKVEDEEMARMAGEQGLEVMKPEAGTRPRVYYRNLWRYSKCFIGGTVSTEVNGVGECVEGATSGSQERRRVAETTSDNYGDFKFDKLDPNSGTYVVEISPPTGRSKNRSRATLGMSINLGEIRL